MSSKSKKIGYTNSVLNGSERNNSWSEWSDIELNAEPWDSPKGGKFFDPQQIAMPRSLRPVEWKRFEELNYVNSPIVYEATLGYPDLITNNEHIMHSEFVRCFVSTLINLQYCGRNGLEIENPTSNFSWNLGDQCWQGWFNVYSLNKAGKGFPHHPVFNPSGRYVVRIFYMGCWRRILIDDLIPIDERGRPMLPRTSNGNELWPMILAKAMLKVAAVSWTEKREIIDCSLVTCLTGWIYLSLNVSHLSTRDQWEFLIKYVKHFEWPRNEEPSTDRAKSDVPEKSTKSRKSKSKVEKLEVSEDSQPTLIFLSLDDTRDVNDEGISGTKSCWNHEIYVELSRDVPLDPTQIKRPLDKWKNYRWLDWAMRRGLTDASEYFVPLRHLLVVSPLKRCAENIFYNHDVMEDYEEQDLSKTALVTNEKNIEDPKMPDISMWEDFNKISYYLREVHLFYRQKFFKHSVVVSNGVINNNLSSFAKSGEKISLDSSARDVKKNLSQLSGRLTTSGKIYEYNHDEILQRRNESFYLFVDSVVDKFFLVNCSVTTPEKTNNSGRKKISSVLIERHEWFENFIDDRLIGVIKTRGTKSLIFQLEPGRHLLRIFTNFASSSSRIIVHSDGPFVIGDRLKMHRLMVTEADRIVEFSQRISDSTRMAFESFGTSSYSSNLKNYYQSYMPDSSNSLNDSERRVVKSIHRWYADEFFNLVERHFSSIDLPVIRRAMRIFFLDPSIGMKMTNLSSHSVNEDYCEENCEDEEWSPNRRATIIQSFFRMALIKRYREIHVTGHAEHYTVKDTLFRIFEILNYERQEYGVNYLLRKIIKRDKCLMKLYTWANDIKHVIEIQELTGRVTNVTSDRWIPIVRASVNTKKSEIVFAAVNLFANLPNYTVRVLENYTNIEMSRIVNDVMPNRYSHGKNGYTIFAYGRDNLQMYKDHDWSLHLTTIRGEPIFHWINAKESSTGKSDYQSPFIREISNTYVPNPRNLIFKMIVKIENNTLVSLRLTTSYEKVLTRLRVTRENSEIVAETEGGEILIMPLVYLEFEATTSVTGSCEKIIEPRKSWSSKISETSSNPSSEIISTKDSTEGRVIENFTRYTIEAFVRKDSWPLTPAEWTLVTKLRENNFLDSGKNIKSSRNDRRSERLRNFSKKSLEYFETTNKPHWCLQIITDTENELEIIRDIDRENKIAELRKIWKTNESERYERGGKLREKFFEENLPIIVSSVIDDANVSTISSENIEEEKIKSIDSLESKISTLNKRTIVPPENFANNLPKLDLTIYMVKDDEEENRWVKTEYDEETLRNQRAINVLDFDHHRSLFLAESTILLEKKREKYRRKERIYLEKRDKLNCFMNEAYKIRQEYVESTKNTASSMRSKDNEKSKKGS